MNIEVNGQVVYYKVTGTAPQTVFILQGWAAPCSLYDAFAVALSNRYRVIQFDFPGFGRSDEPSEPWDVDSYVAFFLAFAKALEVEHATLIGHSYGGRVLIKLAAQHSEQFQIDQLVLVDSAGIIRQRTHSENIRITWFRALRRLVSVPLIHASFPDLIDDWMSRQGSEDYRNASPIMKATMVKSISEDLAPYLPAVHQETLLIWGVNDDATPLSDGERMEQEMPHATLVTIAEAGHFPFLDQPAVFFPILSAYLTAGD